MTDANRYSRQLPLLGENSPTLLASKTLLICGLGGVGGYVLEALTRAGCANFILVDADVFDETNLNRQLLCTADCIGRAKADVAKERVLAINPSATVITEKLFLTEENIPELLDKYKPDYIADAIDNISAKLCLAVEAQKRGCGIISCMGTGNKLMSNAFECVDISKTSVCPLAKVMRRLLKERGVKKLKVIYSKEIPLTSGRTVCSVSFVPPTAGFLMAENIIKDLLGINSKKTPLK